MRNGSRRAVIGRACRFAILLFVCSAGMVTADPTETKIRASDAQLGDRFGVSLAISGDLAVIGAQADDDAGGDAGAAYVLDLPSVTQLRKLHAADAAGGDYFGCAVAASGDWAIAGALRDDHVAIDAGSAYIFDMTNGTQLHKLVASDAAVDDWFGNSVAISPSYALVGAYKNNQTTTIYDTGAAYLFSAVTGAQIRKLIASDYGKQDWYGYAVAVSDEYAAVGAVTWDGGGTGHSNCGAVYVYDVATGVELWRLTTTDQGAEDRFGNALAIQGDYLLAGAYWDTNPGSSDAGAAYLFDLTTGQQVFEFLASQPSGGGDWYGSSVAMSGNYAVIGANQQGNDHEGFACVVDLTTGAEIEMLTASDGALDDEFGNSVAIRGSLALVGSDMDDDNGVNSGSAYIYEPVTPSTGIADAVAPRSFVLGNHPNPFNPSTEIAFTLPTDAAVSLEIYDLSGRLLRTLLPGDRRAAGDVRLTWDGTGDDGDAVPSGVYFYRVEAGEYRAARKMTLLK